jgi:hypothetical protein
MGDLGGAEASFLYLLRREGVEHQDAQGTVAFRLTLVSTAPPTADGTWIEVTRTEKYRLEEREPRVAVLPDAGTRSLPQRLTSRSARS